MVIDNKIGLALSGGGVRASAYHAGVLLYLAEQNLFEQITHISSVSGGTLFTGLIFHFSDMKWPSSKEYHSRIYSALRDILITRSLQGNFVRRLFYPKNWWFLLSRAEVLAESIYEDWDIKDLLCNLPSMPIWSINGTTAETGARFRCKGGRIGDYELGYAEALNFNLASAMAISAAFPVGIGPLSIKTRDYEWKKRPHWGADLEESYVPPYKTIHLYDGGVYDNLGIEPIFDIGNQEFKADSHVDFLVLSDAGAPYEKIKIPCHLNPTRVKRLLDMTTDQTRALRTRCFVNFLKKNPSKGLFCQIGMNPKGYKKGYGVCESRIQNIEAEEWLQADKISEALRYKTTLKRMLDVDFDLISQHGYESAKAMSILFR